MKKLALITLVAGAVFTAPAQVVYYRVYAYPYAGPCYYYPGYGYYPAYPAYPAYGYAYSRPNYALGGTMLGALTGGLIGNSIHHQGWEGAAIGAGAGLLLGSLAEHSARAKEQQVIAAPPPVYYAPPVSAPVANAPTANPTPAASPAPNTSAPASQPAPASTMSSANSLFGR